MRGKQRRKNSLSPSPEDTPTRLVLHADGAVQEAGDEQVRRIASLKRVFARFDMNLNGIVEAEELLAMGKARKELGQKER